MAHTSVQPQSHSLGRRNPVGDGAKFIALLNPNSEQHERMCGLGTLPRWFACPIRHAGYDLQFTRNFQYIRGMLAGRFSQKPLLLIFNVSLVEFLAAATLRRSCRIISLFQWRPLEQHPPLKRLVYRTILSASEHILVYSRIAQEYLQNRYPDKPVSWLGLYTDTEFFQPSSGASPPEVESPFLLVPGNHKRNERLVVEVAEQLRFPLVRVSSEPSVVSEHNLLKSHYVTVLSGLPFERVRSLYQHASAVLNIADDSQWPVGITTFCEAISMNARVITPGGHSASGYHFDDGIKPYYNVEAVNDSSAWCAAVRRLQERNGTFPSGRAPRDLAQKLCSLESVTHTWRTLNGPVHNS